MPTAAARAGQAVRIGGRLGDSGEKWGGLLCKRRGLTPKQPTQQQQARQAGAAASSSKRAKENPAAGCDGADLY